MPLPQINIDFTSMAVSAIQRSARGIVALVLRDGTDTTFTQKEYKTLTDVDYTKWTATNYQYIKDAFLGTPNKVIVIRGNTTDTNYNTQLVTLAGKKWDYLAIPGIANADVTAIATQIKTWRDTNKKTFKAVLPNVIADHEGIINFATGGIVVGSNTYTANQYCARLAGIFAGLSLDRSATFLVLPEVAFITESTTPDADVDAGKLILVADLKGRVKIGRAVNSLTTFTIAKPKTFSKIKVVEGMDLIKEDISTTFEDSYINKYVNSYDNQVLFVTSVNSYLRQLGGTVLDANNDNNVFVDAEAMRTAWTSQGTDVSELTDAQVKEKSFESKVFLKASMKFLDAIEDLSFSITVA